MKRVNEGKWSRRAQSRELRETFDSAIVEDFSGRRYVGGSLHPVSIVDNYFI